MELIYNFLTERAVSLVNVFYSVMLYVYCMHRGGYISYQNKSNLVSFCNLLIYFASFKF